LDGSAEGYRPGHAEAPTERASAPAPLQNW